MPNISLALLQYAAGRHTSDSALAIPISEEATAEDREFLRAINAGLGPLMYEATRVSPAKIPPAWRDVLRSAHLTAQVRFESLCRTATVVIDACLGARVRPTLLKGISISFQHYPVPYTRSMGDIDILVPEADVERVESTLIRSGLVPASDRMQPEGAHHGTPLYHPRHHVFIEVHSALFPRSSALSSGAVFGPAHISACSVASTFQGRQVYRLSNELQLAYIASSWVRDLSRYGMHPSFVLPLLDAVYLLKSCGNSLNWDGLLVGLGGDSELAAASLYVMLSYLGKRGLAACAPHVLWRIASQQRIVGAWEQWIVGMLLDNCLVGNRTLGRFLTEWTSQTAFNTVLERGSAFRKLFALPWNVLFSPSLPHRYNFVFHARRIARMLHEITRRRRRRL